MKSITKTELDKKHKLNKKFLTSINSSSPQKQLGEIADLSYIKFDNLNLKRQMFNGANFEHSQMEYSILNGTQLESAKMKYVYLANSTMIGVDLSNADLSNASLKNCHIANSHMKGTNLSGANLTSSTFNKVDLRDVKLDGATLDHVTLNKCVISNMTDFDGCADINECQLGGDLNYSILE